MILQTLPSCLKSCLIAMMFQLSREGPGRPLSLAWNPVTFGAVKIRIPKPNIANVALGVRFLGCAPSGPQ